MPEPNTTSLPKFRPIRKGEPITAAWANQIVQCFDILNDRGIATIPRISTSAQQCPLSRLSPDPNDADRVYIDRGQLFSGINSWGIGGDSKTFLPAIGEVIWAEVNIAIDVEDLVFTETWTSSAGDWNAGARPTDHEFTDPDNPSGLVYMILGEWIDDGDGNPQWVAAGCGSVKIEL